MERRDFLKYSTGALMGLPLLGTKVFAQDKPEGKPYSVVILGDTHYDDADPEKYHQGYHLENATREDNHRKEFIRNGKMWSGRCQDLVKRAACLIDEDTRFVLQMGDLIQGDTANYETHRRFLEDAVNLFKTSLAPDLPFVTVAGNHDLRGNDDAVASKAYADYMPARLSEELGITVPETNFLLRSGEDAFIVVNFSKPDVSRIEELYREAEGARHTFMVVHSPVFPYDNIKYWWWILLGNRKDSRADERRHIRALMASRNTVVLCGHTHKTELLDWEGDGGRITQMTMSSVWASEVQGQYKELATGAEGYGSQIKQLDPSFDMSLFDEYRPGITRYSFANAAGSYKLIVGEKDIHVDFYAGSSPRLSKRFQLR